MKKTKFMLLIAVGLIFLGGEIWAQSAKEFNYTGTRGCRKCHKSKKSGAQYKVWAKMKHAQAFATLATAEAQKIAKAKGIADAQKADACLKCHVTAFGVAAERLGKKYTIEEGVGCESCHGAGSAYSKRKVKKAIAAGTTKPESVGLLKVTKETCVKCHNDESPTFKSFDFEKAKEKIAHPRPKA